MGEGRYSASDVGGSLGRVKVFTSIRAVMKRFEKFGWGGEEDIKTT